jgi:hypothetical protein
LQIAGRSKKKGRKQKVEGTKDKNRRGIFKTGLFCLKQFQRFEKILLFVFIYFFKKNKEKREEGLI